MPYIDGVNVIAPRTVRAYWQRHATAQAPLKEWLKAMPVSQGTLQKGDFATLNELRAVWPHADLVQAKGGIPVIVFNIGGNNYRLVVNVNWTYKAVYIKRIMTHAEYDVWNKTGRPI